MYQTLIKIKDILERSFGSKIRSYFIEDPNLIPMSALPCLAVSPVSTNIDLADSGRDLFTYTINVILIINAINELEKVEKEIVGTKFLIETMEERDSSGNLEINTIAYILRKNLDLGTNWYIGNVKSIEYGLKIRPEQGLTKEASMRIEVIQITTRPT